MSDNDDDTEKEIAALRLRYEQLAHAVQTGIMYRMEHDRVSGTIMRDPGLLQALKHLRTGIDMGKSDHGGLAGLLISRGVITELEYFRAMVQAAEREKESYEALLSELMHSKITLA